MKRLCRSLPGSLFAAGLVALLAAGALPAEAVTTTYGDRATWEANVDPNTPILLEDFNCRALGSLNDNVANAVGELTVTPVDAPGTAMQDGSQPRQVDGTPFLRTLVDGSPSRSLVISFATPVLSIGFDFSELPAGDDVQITLGNGDNFTLSAVAGGGVHAGFVGFVSDVAYQSITIEDPFISFSDVGIDNFAFAITAPTTITYSSRSSWENATNVRTVHAIVTEDFDTQPIGSLTDNASNTVGTVLVYPSNAPGSAIQDGTATRQVDGTPFLRTLVDGSPLRTMDICFPEPVFAVGFDFSELPAADDVQVTLGNGDNFTLFSAAGGVHDGFVGFVSDVPFSSITVEDPFISFSDVGIDNLCFASLWRPSLDVDGSDASPLETELGFTRMTDPGMTGDAGNGAFSPAGADEGVTVTVTGGDQYRDRGVPPTAQTYPQLVRDFIGRDGVNAQITVTISGLPAGPYEITSFHHDWFVWADLNYFDIRVDDALGTNRLVVDDALFPQSEDYTGESYFVSSNGVDDVVLRIRESSATNRVRFNGLVLESADAFFADAKNVSLNGGGTSLNVCPGDEFELELDFSVWNRSTCPGCIAQIVIGIGDTAVDCVYDGVPGVFPGVSGPTTMTLTAPTTPGTYPIRWENFLEFGCANALGNFSSDLTKNVIGTITVGDPAATFAAVSNVNINGAGTNVNVVGGSTVDVALGYKLWNSAGCPGCIAQITVGIGDTGQDCVFDAIPGVFPGASGSAVVSLTAPTTPGTYPVRWDNALQFSCAGAIGVFSTDEDENVIGTITVGDPGAQFVGISNVSIDGGSNVAALQPGSTFALDLDYVIWDTNCPGCIEQIVIGVGDTGQDCAYNGQPGAHPGASGSSLLTLTAPAVEGTYALRWDREAQFSCGNAIPLFSTDLRANVIGKIIVSSAVDAPVLTNSTIPVELQVYPNPFRSGAEMRFSLNRTEPVTLDVYNLAGQRVTRLLDAALDAGNHQVTWSGRDADGRPVAAGMYFVRMQTPTEKKVKQVLRLR